MPEFTAEIDHLTHLLERANKLAETVNDHAWDIWHELNLARRNSLLKVLDLRELDFCDRTIYSELEVVPKSEIVINYRNALPIVRGHELVDDIKSMMYPNETLRRRQNIYFNCQLHRQNDLDLGYSPEDGQPNFVSEVLEKDGRLITKLYNRDVTDEVAQARISRTYPETLFQHFNFPPLPPKPITISS